MLSKSRCETRLFLLRDSSPNDAMFVDKITCRVGAIRGLVGRTNGLVLIFGDGRQ